MFCITVIGKLLTLSIGISLWLLALSTFRFLLLWLLLLLGWAWIRTTSGRHFTRWHGNRRRRNNWCCWCCINRVWQWIETWAPCGYNLRSEKKNLFQLCIWLNLISYPHIFFIGWYISVSFAAMYFAKIIALTHCEVCPPQFSTSQPRASLTYVRLARQPTQNACHNVRMGNSSLDELLLCRRTLLVHVFYIDPNRWHT